MPMEDPKINLNQVGCHFLDFAVHFFTLSKGHFRQQNLVKANSLAFNTLVTLNELADSCLTMSDLASRLEITKQQLTKLVNDLEEKDLVNRIHNPQNRRQVYIRITDHGCTLLKVLREEMLYGMGRLVWCYQLILWSTKWIRYLRECLRCRR